MHSVGWNLIQRKLRYSSYTNQGPIVYPGKCVALGKSYAKNEVKDYEWFLSWNFLIMDQRKPPWILPWKMQENIIFQVLVSLTDKIESTLLRYSHWQLRKVTKTLCQREWFKQLILSQTKPLICMKSFDTAICSTWLIWFGFFFVEPSCK